jgi:pyrroloquinoline-quinone synthase
MHDRIRQLRDLASREAAPGLADCLDAATALAKSLPKSGSSELQEILKAVSALVELVETSLSHQIASPGAIEPADKSEQGLIKNALFGQILVHLGVVTEDQVEAGLELGSRKGIRIGEALAEMGAANTAQIQEALRIQNQLRQAYGTPGDLFGAIVPHHPLWEHPFLRRCRAQDLSVEDVKTLAGQMYKFCSEFSRILAATFVRCPDEYARVVIADNLYDETGCGNEKRAHPELYRRFTRALGISDQELEDVRIEPETQNLIDTYLGFPKRYGYLASLGAICYASENIVSALYKQMLAGIENSVSVPEDALIFFRSHVELDVEHAHALINVVNRAVKTIAEAEKVGLAIKEALAARMRFFDGIERCSRQRQGSGKRATDALI